MKIEYKSKRSSMKLFCVALASCLFAGCTNYDIDNTYSRNNSIIDITASSDYVVLDESAPDAVALTVEWTPAADLGNDYITTYQYQMELLGSKADAIQEYEDGGVFRRSYTNKQLQEILINNFQQLTSTRGEMKFTVNASFEGPRLVVPDMASITIKVKTYGAKQFKADKVYMGGEAVGEKRIELTSSSNNANLYVYNGKLSAGKINFPVLYGDEENAISPVSADMEITSDAMEATVVDLKEAHSWIIPEEDNYRVTINFSNQTVTIMPAGDIIEVDKIYLAGTATNGLTDEEKEVTQTLENADLYAFRGELKAGKLYLPILFNELKAISIVPSTNGHDISDGNAVNFAQVSTESATDSRYWEIPADGTYRIVVDTDLKTITIYSSATDLKPKETGTWNAAAVDGSLGTTYKCSINELWMYGTFNNYAHDSGLPSGFEKKYTLIQSKANPRVFVYKGTPLPRNADKDYFEKPGVTASVVFYIGVNGKTANNAWAFGSTAPNASRNNRICDYITAKTGVPETLKEGQGDNRYAYFIIPVNTNYVMVDIDNLKVVFDNK